jgi:hypothetical protein
MNKKTKTINVTGFMEWPERVRYVIFIPYGTARKKRMNEKW